MTIDECPRCGAEVSIKFSPEWAIFACGSEASGRLGFWESLLCVPYQRDCLLQVELEHDKLLKLLRTVRGSIAWARGCSGHHMWVQVDSEVWEEIRAFEEDC